MLGWKSIFTSTIFENKKIKPVVAIKNWLALDSLETLATVSLKEKIKGDFAHAERIDLRPAKGYISFAYRHNYNVQVDGATGSTILIEQKNGSLIQDIHDGAIVDGWLGNNSGLSKKIYTSIIGLALLILTISGFYLWYKPRLIKRSKK
jgi:hypothetical protein